MSSAIIELRSLFQQLDLEKKGEGVVFITWSFALTVLSLSLRVVHKEQPFSHVTPTTITVACERKLLIIHGWIY